MRYDANLKPVLWSPKVIADELCKVVKNVGLNNSDEKAMQP